MLLFFVAVCSDHVVKKANIATTSTGNDIATFREVSALSPRGRYDIKFYPTFVHLHGKTFDYKVTITLGKIKNMFEVHTVPTAALSAEQGCFRMDLTHTVLRNRNYF
jgi:hypothetical protein